MSADNGGLGGLLQPGDGMNDDPNTDPSTLRFAVGNLVIYKRKDGWQEGEIFRVAQLLTLGDRRQRIAYLVWPLCYLPDDEMGTEWVYTDSDECIRPRPEDKTPDPANFRPLLTVPEDPMYFLYTNTEKFDAQCSDGPRVADVLGGRENPDGSVSMNLKGRKVKTAMLNIPGNVHGVDGYTAMIFSVNNISTRKSGPAMTDPMVHFESIVPPERSLAQLEKAAKTSNDKMLQLADALMLGCKGWPRDPYRACNLYRAAAWGCSEEEQMTVRYDSIPVGPPEALLAVCGTNIAMLRQKAGIPLDKPCMPRIWMAEGLKSDENMEALRQICFWVSQALKLHGHVTPLALTMAQGIQDIRFLTDARVTDEIKEHCEQIMKAYQCRQLEIEAENMMEQGNLPRGDASEDALAQFAPKAVEIFEGMPKANDELYIEFKPIPRPPYSMVVLMMLPAKGRIQKVVTLPDSLQACPFSQESFEYAFIRLSYDLHLGRLRTNARNRPSVFSVLDDGHGNTAFAAFLEEKLKACNTQVKLIKASKRINKKKTAKSYGTIVSGLMTTLLDIPGFLFSVGSMSDDASLAQEAFYDEAVIRSERAIGEGADINVSDKHHLQEASRWKSRGNELFQSRKFNIAVKCYSFALSHLRRVVKFDQTSYTLLGTTLSNRALCALGLADEANLTSEFRLRYTRMAIEDTETALRSSWCANVPQNIRGKLRFSRDKATARYDSLLHGAEITMSNLLWPKSETAPEETVDDILIEYGEVLVAKSLARNANEGCPICLREFSSELSKTYSVVLPCQHHAICIDCSHNIQKQSDSSRKLPRCPLCRATFGMGTLKQIPTRLIEYDEEISSLLSKLDMEMDKKISIATELMWKNKFHVASVVDAIEGSLDDQVTKNCSCEKNVWLNLRSPVADLEKSYRSLAEEQAISVDAKRVEELSIEIAKMRKELAMARAKAREILLGQM